MIFLVRDQRGWFFRKSSKSADGWNSDPYSSYVPGAVFFSIWSTWNLYLCSILLFSSIVNLDRVKLKGVDLDCG